MISLPFPLISRTLSACLIGLCLIPFFAKSQPPFGKVDSMKGLKDYYQSYFPMGVAVSPTSLTGQESNFILSQFNSLTPENALKMGPIHPEENRYHWNEADEIVQFAQNHGLKVRGHNLCWHEQTPKWLFLDKEGRTVTKEVLLKRLKDHIYTVVNRYKGKIYAWDVVNEAISDNNNQFLRDSPWSRICGIDYIVEAFKYAHEADPNAQLFYNDYNTENPEKRERIYKLLKLLLDSGVPVQGMGLQAHWSIFYPSSQEVKASIDKFSSLGLKIQITELDISIYPWEKEPRALKMGEKMEFTPEIRKIQDNRYADFFKVFRENRDKITGITFWNVSDRYTWLDNYPVRGRKNFPLLFDQNLKPKSSFYRVIEF